MERKNKGESQPKTPRSRSQEIPSLREEMVWWKCRSRSPLSNPQEWARIMGGIKREGKFFKDNNGGERVEELVKPKVEEGLFIAQAEI